MREHRVMRVISAVGKVLLVIVAVPLALIAGVVSTVFGLKAKLSAAEVAKYLRDYIEGTGSNWDWDDFTSVPIADPQLDEIRREATAVTAPDTEDAPTVLKRLLVQAERLAAQDG
jgi:hypothetical protein